VAVAECTLTIADGNCRGLHASPQDRFLKRYRSLKSAIRLRLAEGFIPIKEAIELARATGLPVPEVFHGWLLHKEATFTWTN